MYEVCLPPIRFRNRTEIIPANAQVQRQLRSNFPVILKVAGKIDPGVIGLIDIGRKNLVGPTDVTNPIWHRRSNWSKQQLRTTRLISPLPRDAGIVSIEIKLAASDHIHFELHDASKLSNVFFELYKKNLVLSYERI